MSNATYDIQLTLGDCKIIVQLTINKNNIDASKSSTVCYALRVNIAQKYVLNYALLIRSV